MVIKLSTYLPKKDEKGERVKRFCSSKVFIKRFSCASSVVNPNKEDSELSIEESAENTDEVEKALARMKVTEDTLERSFATNPFTNERVKQFAISYKEYKKDRTKPARQIFTYRVKQVIAYIKKCKVTKLPEDMEYLTEYLKEYLEHYITDAMNQDKQLNLITSLKLNTLISDRKTARELQKVLKKAKNELQNQGSMTRATQKRMWGSFNKLFASILYGIVDRISDPLKKDIVSSVADTIYKRVDGNKSEEEENEEDSA